MALFPAFGKNPTGDDQQRIQQSPQYREGGFRNQSPTEMMVRRHAMPVMLWKFLNKPAYTTPPGPVPAVTTNLRQLETERPVLVWFGHSSYLLRLGGITILVDPVFSGHASPFSFGANSFPGADVYSPEDMPDIDLLLITHDHYDHLDHRTFRRLLPRVKKIYTSLGVGSHLVYWGADRKTITEFDWGDSHQPTDDLVITAAPARHFSGRSLNRNQTLWASWVFKTPDTAIYAGADSGYDQHFQDIGARFGPFDLAILETGQYNQDWPYIHMMPEEAVQAALDLRAGLLLPVHWGKFALAFHPWDEPVKRVLEKAGMLNVPVATPKIGEPLVIGGSVPTDRWWETVV